jgi:hypothetical protein
MINKSDLIIENCYNKLRNGTTDANKPSFGLRLKTYDYYNKTMFTNEPVKLEKADMERLNTIFKKDASSAETVSFNKDRFTSVIIKNPSLNSDAYYTFLIQKTVKNDDNSYQTFHIDMDSNGTIINNKEYPIRSSYIHKLGLLFVHDSGGLGYADTAKMLYEFLPKLPFDNIEKIDALISKYKVQAYLKYISNNKGGLSYS